MFPKLAVATFAALAAVILGITATRSAPARSVEVGGNHVATGGLVLDLGADGSTDTTIRVTGLMPGTTERQALWVARNDPASSVAATLHLTFRQLRDRAGPCATSLDKARAEIASGIAGCTVDNDTARGRPAQGNLSRLLAADVRYAPLSTTPASCMTAAAVKPSVLDGTPGDLRSRVRTTVPADDGTHDLVLAPGAAACVVVTFRWPPDVTSPDSASPEHPLDNAAQGDSLRVGVRFDLRQARS